MSGSLQPKEGRIIFVILIAYAGDYMLQGFNSELEILDHIDRIISLIQQGQEQEAIKGVKLVPLPWVKNFDRQGNNLLHHAQNADLLELAGMLVELHPQLITMLNFKKRAPLHDAAEQGKLNFLGLYLAYAHCIDVNTRGAEDRTALHFATIKRHEAAADLLLAANVDVHARDNGNCTAFSYADSLPDFFGTQQLAQKLKAKMTPTLFELTAQAAMSAGNTQQLPEEVVHQAQRTVLFLKQRQEEEARKLEIIARKQQKIHIWTSLPKLFGF